VVIFGDGVDLHFKQVGFDGEEAAEAPAGDDHDVD
jgi:hypothetical protein